MVPALTWSALPSIFKKKLFVARMEVQLDLPITGVSGDMDSNATEFAASDLIAILFAARTLVLLIPPTVVRRTELMEQLIAVFFVAIRGRRPGNRYPWLCDHKDLIV